MQWIKECPFCHREFVAERRNTVFCCNACRQANWRAVHAKRFKVIHDELPEPIRRPITRDEIADAVVQTRAAVATFSAGRLTADPPLRPVCKKLEDGILQVLKEVGV